MTNFVLGFLVLINFIYSKKDKQIKDAYKTNLEYRHIIFGHSKFKW